ncbi:hypothetical protein YYE_00006 [Plasmodium vinckei vinckei]|nr:hypothetical protein YYE_00006 [Plasmodium vinckei vinckei]
MESRILKFVFFSIIICSFEYAKNELYYVNERSIYLERNIIYFRNNRILEYIDNQFDLYDFYESTLNLANQFNSRIKNHKGSNISPNLNNVDGKTKKLIHKIQKELNEAKKELDNIKNDKLAIQPIQDKRITKKMIILKTNIMKLHQVKNMRNTSVNLIFIIVLNKLNLNTFVNKIKSCIKGLCSGFYTMSYSFVLWN